MFHDGLSPGVDFRPLLQPPVVARQRRRVLVVIKHLAVAVLAGRRAQALLADRTLGADRVTNAVAPEPPVGLGTPPAAFPLVIPPAVAGQLLNLGTYVHVPLLVVVELPGTIAAGLAWLVLPLGDEGLHAQGFHRSQLGRVVSF